jgi:hypothetical protein
LTPGLALAQTAQPTPPPPPPPIVTAPDAPTAQPANPQPAAGAQQPTPPPPGYNPPVTNPGYNGYQQPGYQPYYGMPYGQPGAKPTGPEIGLMITEGAFGMLTAAAEVLLPFLLFDALSQGGAGFDPTLMNILIVGILIAEPLAVSQTVLGIANSSRYYYSESWPAMLTGLGATGAIIGLMYLTLTSSVTSNLDNMLPYLIAAVVVVPLAEVVVLNLTKQPKSRMFGALNFSGHDGWHASVPVPMPFAAPTPVGLEVGVTLPLLAGRF